MKNNSPNTNNTILSISSDVTASGPKGLVKSDILSHIKAKGLTPIKIAADKPEQQKKKETVVKQTYMENT